LLSVPISKTPAKRHRAIPGRTAEVYRWPREVLCDLGPCRRRAYGAAGYSCFGACCKPHPQWPQPATDQLRYHQCAGNPWQYPAILPAAAIRDVFPLGTVLRGMAISHGITESMIALTLGVVADRKGSAGYGLLYCLHGGPRPGY